MSGERDDPRISIVIPHLNEESNLRHCLEAIYADAGGHRIEVIVADNGSQPPPYAVMSAFPSVRLTIEKVPGPGPARNSGAMLARGELICFIDCDCFVEKGYFEAVFRFFDSRPDIAFAGGSIGIRPSDPKGLKTVEAYEAVFSYRTEMFVERDKFAATGNMVVRRQVFAAVGPFAGIGAHEDIVWGQKAAAMGYAIAHLPQARVLTVGCGEFPELARRIERHVAHDYLALPKGGLARVKWIARAGLVALSPPLGIRAILHCSQVRDNWLRLRVFSCLCHARANRARQMIEVMRGGSRERLATWNRSRTPQPRIR